mgnify:CR=1 FL=1
MLRNGTGGNELVLHNQWGSIRVYVVSAGLGLKCAVRLRNAMRVVSHVAHYLQEIEAGCIVRLGGNGEGGEGLGGAQHAFT